MGKWYNIMSTVEAKQKKTNKKQIEERKSRWKKQILVKLGVI